MVSREKLQAAVSRLRGVGFEDAAQGQPRVGDPTHVLSVTADSDADEGVVRDLVLDVDPSSSRL